MRIEIKCNFIVKEYNDDLDYQKLGQFIREEFSISAKYFSIDQASFAESQKTKSLQRLCEKAIPMNIELNVDWKAMAYEQMGKNPLKNLFCKKVETLQLYSRKNTEQMFEFAKRSKRNLFKYPFFHAFNRWNYELRTKGAMKLLKKMKQQPRRNSFTSSDYTSEQKMIYAHLLELCGLEHSSYPNTFLNHFLETPCDMLECQTWIFTNDLWQNISKDYKIIDSVETPPHEQSK